MAQTTGATSMRNVVIEISTDNSAWTDISGVANKIKSKGPKRKSGSMNTGGSDKPVMTIGKLDTLELEVDIVYSEVSTEAYTLIEGYFKNATPLYMRYAPKGTATGNYRYTTDAGYVTECPPPAGDLDKGDPLAVSFTHESPGYTRAAI